MSKFKKILNEAGVYTGDLKDPEKNISKYQKLVQDDLQRIARLCDDKHLAPLGEAQDQLKKLMNVSYCLQQIVEGSHKKVV